MNLKLKVYGLAGILIFISANTHAELLQIDDMNCPDKPNCVSSLVKDSTHYIEPFTFNDAPEKAMARLKTALLQEKGITLVTNEAEVLKAEVKSFIFRFIDDVEFSLLTEQKVIHVRSSSRTGYYDFGVNRRRIERIRQRFQN
ncbi:MAG: DUF1499 domain-containing protein [Gammaproteobacteria bacterium]